MLLVVEDRAVGKHGVAILKFDQVAASTGPVSTVSMCGWLVIAQRFIK